MSTQQDHDFQVKAPRARVGWQVWALVVGLALVLGAAFVFWASMARDETLSQEEMFVVYRDAGLSPGAAACMAEETERQGYAEAMYNDDQEAFKEFTASEGFARCTLLDEGSTP